jgi:cell division protein FtsB
MRRRRVPRSGTTISGLLASLPFDAGRSGARLIAFVLVVLALWLLANFVGQVIAGAQLDREIARKQATLVQLAEENRALEEELAFAQSPAYAELIAREQLGYAREGDTVILPTFPERPAAPEVEAPTPLPTPVPEPNWRGWTRAFFSTELHSTYP